MNKEVIATIKLAAGRVGFYDPLSRIHLTLGRPTAHVYAGTNCASLRRNVKAGVIRLVNGTLGEEVPPFKVVKIGDQFKLASNVEEEMKPVYAKKAAPEAKKAESKQDEKAKIKEIQDKAEAEVRAKLESDKKTVAKAEEKKEEKLVKTVSEEKHEETAKKPAAKTTAKKTVKKTTNK